MKKEKVVGILGGLGPEATLRLFQVILEKTPASSDQDHLHLIIDNNPKIPERLPAILGTGPDPVPMMVASGQALERAGADFIIIPCVSAHYFLPELSRRLSLPIISMLDEAAVRIKAFKPQIKKAGAQGILSGCTEISIVIDPSSFSVPGFDALTILGQAAIREAGLTPL